jgi:hypothetical protein
MAAWCHEQATADPDAWRCGMQALATAEALPPEGRSPSTLPWLGQALLRLVRRNYGEGEQASRLWARLDAVMGAGWERALGEGAPAR